jgi:hypothetical protein
MLTPSPGGSQSTSLLHWHGWKPLGVVVLLGGLLIAGVRWFNDEPKVPVAKLPPGTQPPPRLPTPVAAAEAGVSLSLVARDHFEGVPVLRIRSQADGDEVLIEVATGKLLAVREMNGKLTRWSRMDDVPMTMMEPTIKGS